MSEFETRSILAELAETVEAEGLTPDSPVYGRRLRQLQVVRCREMHLVASCTECIAYEWCGLIRQVLADAQKP